MTEPRRRKRRLWLIVLGAALGLVSGWAAAAYAERARWMSALRAAPEVQQDAPSPATGP